MKIEKSHPLSRNVCMVGLLVLHFSLAPTALAQSVWFGLDLPPGIGDPHAATVDVGGASPAVANVPAGETENHLVLEGERILPLVDEIIEFSRQSRRDGNRVWGRVTGFPSAQQTLEWAGQQFEQAGLQQVQVQVYAGQSEFWWPRDWEVRLLADPAFGAGSADVVLESSLVTSGSEIEGGVLTANLVDTGHINDPVPAIDLTGKVAVQTLTPQTGAYSERTPTRERARLLIANGAVAVINVVEQLGNMHTRDFSNCNGPCFNIGTADGHFLKAALARASAGGLADRLQVRLSLDASYLTGLTGHNAVGIVPGDSAENIIVNAHADGWYDAAGDNADGLAVLVAMARHFARPMHRQERTLVFVASGGHHSPGLNGPGAFVQANPELVANTVLVINLEHIAQFQIDSSDWSVGPREQPMNFGISNASPLLNRIAQQGVERYGFNLNPQFSTSTPGDLGGYRSLGVPMVQAIHSGPLYHASGDVFATISEPGLERAARFYTWFVKQAAAAPRNQIDP